MTEEIYVDQMHKWENVWSTIKQLSKEEISKIPKEFLRTSKIPEHKVKIKKWEKSEEIIENFDDDLSNIILYDVDVVMENTEHSSTSIISSNNDIAPIDQEKAAELMATPAPETSIDSNENTSQATELTISNTVNNSVSNLSTVNSTSNEISSGKHENSNTENVPNGSRLRYEILPQGEANSSNEKSQLKKVSSNEEHADKRMKLDENNEKHISNKTEDFKSEVKEEKNNVDKFDIPSNDNNSLKRKADELSKSQNSSDKNINTLSPSKKTLINSDYKSKIDENKVSNNISESRKCESNNILNDVNKDKNDIANTGNKIKDNNVNENLKSISKENNNTSLFDHNGCIILKPFSNSLNDTTIEKEKLSKTNENLMDVDKNEVKSKSGDPEQSNTDSTFGLKSYNSGEFSTDASCKKFVGSIEDSNISTISEISITNNDDSLDLSSSVDSSNVKKIIERLENNTINNESFINNDSSTIDEKNDKYTKQHEKLEELQKSSSAIIDKKISSEIKNDLSKVNNNDKIADKKNETTLKENADKAITSSEQVKKIDNTEKRNIADNKKEENSENNLETGLVMGNKESNNDTMDIDDKPKNVIIEGNVENKIKLFEQNNIKNNNDSIEEIKKSRSEDKSQEVKKYNDKKSDVKEEKTDSLNTNKSSLSPELQNETKSKDEEKKNDLLEKKELLSEIKEENKDKLKNEDSVTKALPNSN